MVTAAHDLFMTRNYGEVSIDDILKRSGVSRGAFYHHFPTKLDLFLVIYRESETRVLGEIGALASGANGPFEALLDASRAYLRLCEHDEEFRRIGLIQARVVLGWEGWREAASELGIAVALFMVNAAIEAGELRPLDPGTLAQILVGTLIEAAMLIVVADDRAEARERSESVVIALLEGLRME